MKRSFILFLSILSLISWSCRNSVRDLDRDVTSAKSYSIAQQYFSDPYLWMNKLLVNPSITKNALYYLDSVENCISNVQVNPFPKLGYTDIVMEFDDDATCFDGRVRKGKLTARLWGNYKTEGSRLSVRTNFYFINDAQVSIEDSLENTGRALDSSITFSSRVRNGTIEEDSLYIEWDGNHEYTWQSGERTKVYHDDDFYIVGSVRTRAYNGNYATAIIIEPLYRDLGCFWVTGGTVELQPENLLPRTINYGTGQYCENDIDVTIAQTVKSITIDDAGF
jgi:hypothetical protein